MDLKDIVSIVSLLSTLTALAYLVGQLRSVFATKEQLAASLAEIRAELNKRERESINAHNGLATRVELEALERDLQADIKELKHEVTQRLDKLSGQYQGLLESVTGLASRLTAYLDKSKGG